MNSELILVGEKDTPYRTTLFGQCPQERFFQFQLEVEKVFGVKKDLEASNQDLGYWHLYYTDYQVGWFRKSLLTVRFLVNLKTCEIMVAVTGESQKLADKWAKRFLDRFTQETDETEAEIRWRFAELIEDGGGIERAYRDLQQGY